MILFTYGQIWNNNLKCLSALNFFFSEMASLDMALNLVRGPRQLLALAPRLASLLLFSDLLEIEIDLPEIETDLPEIEILSYELENKISTS